jgi:hypothetical protein
MSIDENAFSQNSLRTFESGIGRRSLESKNFRIQQKKRGDHCDSYCLRHMH